MKSGALGLVAVVAVVVGAGAGYWWGQRAPHAAQGGREPAAAGAVATAEPGAKKERKLLFYRNPMGLPDTSPTPKKDPMGMDYIPVYEGDDEPSAGREIRISVDKVQKLGVRTEPAALRPLDKVVRAAGRIEVDERRVFTVAPKFEGWVERLYVNATGQAVAKGQPLFDAYSPELVSAQREYAIAAEGVKALGSAGDDAQAGMRRLAESSLARLRNWDVSEEQVKALAQSGETHRTLAFRSPVAGIVMEKKAMQGMRFMPGEALYQIADLSSVWVIADVFEQDLAEVRLGDKARVTIGAYPERAFDGRVAYIYPTLKAETRTVPVRLELANPGFLLKPGMFAQLELAGAAQPRRLTVPLSAVIDSGTRRIALVRLGEGRFEPREVKLGRRSDNYVEILDGLRDGENVVVAANFLIDAESNLKAAIGGFGTGGTPDAATSPAAGGGVGHRADGTVDAIDPKTGVLTVTHGPVPSLKWPGMTMEFGAANAALLKDLKPGAAIAFEFVERKPGEWVITKVEPRAGPTPAR
jgi:Cu(I)/Ag(I) efflux system membrane fusion protein